MFLYEISARSSSVIIVAGFLRLKNIYEYEYSILIVYIRRGVHTMLTVVYSGRCDQIEMVQYYWL